MTEEKQDATLRSLRRARELLAVRKGWTQHKYARDNADRPCLVSAAYACRFCATGAIYKANRDTGSPFGSDAERTLGAVVRKETTAFCITSWNDAKERTQHEVLAMFDKAIALREKKLGVSA